MADEELGLMEKIMSGMSDDKGLFQGGQDDRLFGRARDALEGRKGTIGHGPAMALSGVPKTGEESWQRDLDYADLPEETKRFGGIRAKLRGSSSGTGNIDLGRDYYDKELQHAVANDPKKSRSMMLDYMSARTSKLRGEGYDSDLLHGDERFAYGLPSLKKFGLDYDYLHSRPNEIASLYGSLEDDESRGIFRDYLGTEAELDYGQYGMGGDIGYGGDPGKHGYEAIDKYINRPNEAVEAGGIHGGFVGEIMSGDFYDDIPVDVRDLVRGQSQYGATTKGQEGFKKGFDRRIEDVGY